MEIGKLNETYNNANLMQIVCFWFANWFEPGQL